ncbi:MAG: fasciclin domain-containing protein [Gemmatimonadaceae bacterium]|nr:fasciclin domain-containing protein [Gemmatimonadaceae bacterium]
MTHHRTLGLATLVALAACSKPDGAGSAVADTAGAPAAAASQSELGPRNIIQVAEQAGSFNTLTSALRTAGLADSLGGEGPFTVLAPSDAAFAKLPPDQLNALLADTAKLARVLRYHVIDGKVSSTDVAAMKEATTLSGEKVGITVVNGAVTLNKSATVTSPDIVASNGVIHVIDRVLVPQRP